jgi:hypothetical protein
MREYELRRRALRVTMKVVGTGGVGYDPMGVGKLWATMWAGVGLRCSFLGTEHGRRPPWRTYVYRAL